MEVTVLEAQNTPKKPVIAVRAGSSLRHAEMVLNEPFRVPTHGLEDKRIKVSLYEQLGTQTIPDADELESVCNVPVRTPDGACGQVKLRVRRGQTSPSFNGNLKNTTGAAVDYLNTHQLEARMQGLFEIVLRQQPPCPYRCMIQELQKIKRAGEQSLAAQAPKAPVAPDGPPPKNGRPSPAAKGRNYKPSAEERASQAEVDCATTAALAQINSTAKESSSLGNVRQSARAKAAEALSNLELAHEVMRLCIRQIVAKMAMQSSSFGSARDKGRQYAIEHSKNRAISHYVIIEVVREAAARLQAESLGIMGGGHTDSDYIIPDRDWAQAAQDSALTQAVVRAALRKAL